MNEEAAGMNLIRTCRETLGSDSDGGDAVSWTFRGEGASYGRK